MLLSKKIILLASIVCIGLASTISMNAWAGALEEFDAFIREKEKESISYSQEEWNKMRNEKEQGIFVEEEEILAPSKVEEIEELKPEEKEAVPAAPEGIGIILPFESRLSITGRKMISMKYGAVFYKDEENRTTTGTPSGVTEGFDMDQELQVKIKGQVGRKITVNVDYDDTVEDKRDISVVYKGDPEEIVQEAAFGDITLELPATEFVAYKKSVFGGKLNAQYKKFKLMAIGSQTKGIPEEKKFKGKSTFEKRDINDTSYQRREYYKLWDENIQSGSEKVYIDDRDGTNNYNGAWMMVRNSDLLPNATYYGYFNLQVPGQDYTIDYVKGILTFRDTIYENYVIAVDYKNSDGQLISVTNSNFPRTLKDEDEILNQEMMNYYDLGRKKIIQGVEGRDFVVKILDLNRKEVTIFGNIYDLIDMDYDEGILKFKDPTPFYNPPYGYADIYDKTNPQHHYIIYVEYKYRQKTYFLQPNIVEGSEKIKINGRLIKRDEDYFIDYESGFITFFREEEIDEETEIEINYEYMPFAGLYQETLLGARGEWAPSDRLFLGSTFLYSGAAKPGTIPTVRTTPASKFILDANSEISFDPQSFFPFKTKISGELARSLDNPNTWGKAIIDSMEGIKLTDGMPTDKDVWQIASNPGAVSTQEGAISWENEDVRIKEFKPNADVGEDEKQEVLKIKYDLTGNATASIVYPISTRGVDYSQKESLELYVYGDGKGEILEIRLGSIAEDADGDGVLDTEDVNGDGTLNVGEDVGWPFSGWTGDDEEIYLRDGKIGYKNGRIDTEDLDGDRVGPEPDKDDGDTFSTVINWSGWKKVEWDLGITTATASNWTAIKHIRIALIGTNVSGSVKVTSIGVVGNKWERGVVAGGGSGDYFSVGAVNTEDDYDIYGRGLLDNKDYEDLYGEKPAEEEEVEQALSLKYTLTAGATGYTKWTFTRAEDYSKYKELRFFIRNPDYPTKNPTFIMRLGSPDAYYQFEKTADWSDWKLLAIELEDIDGKYGADTMTSSDGTITKVGAPSLTNIAEIRLMIVNTTGSNISDGEIWVNEIHLIGARKKEGWAGRLGLDCELPDWFTFGGKYWYMDRNFETITVPSKNQDKEVISAYTNFNRLSYLPVSLNWSRTTTVTPSVVNVADLSVQDEGRVVSHEGSASAEIRLPKLPSLGTGYSKSIVERSQPEGKKEDSDTYSVTLNQYELPIRFFLLPYDLGGSYKRINKFNDFTSTAPTQNDFWEFTNDWSGKATFRPLSKLSILPSYSLRKVRERVHIDGKIGRPRSGTQTAGFSSSLQFFEWLKPSIDYKISNTENFIIVSSTSVPEQKNFTRSSSAKLSLPFVAKSLFPKFEPVASLNVNSSYELNDGDTYESIREDYPIYGKLWLRDSGMGYKRLEGIEDKLKSFSIQDTLRLESSWKPLEFLNLKGYLYPFKTLTADIDYTHTQSHQGPTVLDSEKRIWPYLDLRMGSVEKFPLLGSVMEEAELITKYILTKEDAKNISSGKTVNFSEDLRFKLFKDYYCWLTYGSSWNRVESAPSWQISQEGFSRDYNAQITFTWWDDWRFNIKYGYKKAEGETGGEKTSESRIHAPSIDVEARVPLPELWKIPLIGKRIRTAGEMKLKARFSAEIKRSELNVERDNTDTYSSLLSSDFNVGTNLMLTLGTGMTFFVNRALPQNNFFAVDVNTTLTIKF